MSDQLPREVGPEDADEQGVLRLWYDPDDIDNRCPHGNALDDGCGECDADRLEQQYGGGDDWDDEELDYCIHGVGPHDLCPECEREALKPLP